MPAGALTASAQADRQFKARSDFRELLAETKCITFRSAGNAGDDPDSPHGKEIRIALRNDRRWFELDCASDERESILLETIAELGRRGAPPPPTASAQ